MCIYFFIMFLKNAIFCVSIMSWFLSSDIKAVIIKVRVDKRNPVFVTNSDFLIPIFFQKFGNFTKPNNCE